MTHHTLGSCQNCVVIGEDHTLAPLFSKQFSIDSAYTCNQTISGGIFYEIFKFATTALCCNDEGSIFHKAAFIDQIRDVFPSCPQPFAVPLDGCLRAGCVQGFGFFDPIIPANLTEFPSHYLLPLPLSLSFPFPTLLIVSNT